MTRETIFALLKDVQQGGISPENAFADVGRAALLSLQFECPVKQGAGQRFAAPDR